MSKLICICLFVILTTSTYAQSEKTSFLLDTALIKVGYDRQVIQDTLNPLNVENDYLTLQAGKNASAFYSAEYRVEDSLITFSDTEKFLLLNRDEERRKRRARLEKEVIFRRHDIDQTWSHLRFDLTNWILYESLEKPNWVITDETDIILGFPCIKATTNFRGREWIAFFTPDIPIQEGPWKLYGLPGLILKAYDSKRHYFYEAKDINSKSPGLVEYVNYSDRLVLKDRIKSLKLRNEAKKKDIRQIMTHAFGIKIKPNPQMKKEDEAAKNHDFEETDYPHGSK